MSFLNAKEYVIEKGYGDSIIHMEENTATVALAAAALGVIPARIAKTLSFRDGDRALLIVMAGDTGVDNKKFRETFGFKAGMLTPEKVEELVGHKVGGVCPFGIKSGVSVYADVSLKRFESVFPACGDELNVMKLSVEELYDLSNAKAWVDVGKLREQKNEESA